MSADGISTLEKFGAGEKLHRGAGYGIRAQMGAKMPLESRRSLHLARVRRAIAPPTRSTSRCSRTCTSPSNGADVVTLREGIKLARTLLAAESFDPYRAEEVYPSAAVQSDADIDAYVRCTVHSANALTASCRMGRDDNAAAVLASRGRVRGIGSLRVIDASAMPHIIGGQTCAPTIMIAEKGSDLVRSNPAGGARRWRGAVEDASGCEGRAHTRLRGDEQHSAWERSIGPQPPWLLAGRERRGARGGR